MISCDNCVVIYHCQILNVINAAADHSISSLLIPLLYTSTFT